jgi:hypothetical protein
MHDQEEIDVVNFIRNEQLSTQNYQLQIVTVAWGSASLP